MTFEQLLRLKGHNKASFARYIGRNPKSVVKWGNKPPLYAKKILESLPDEGGSRMPNEVDMVCRRIDELENELKLHRERLLFLMKGERL